jgi:uncharacterized membrane protein YeaQ/YmgE (transglycosylase-associated protein family)
MLIGVLGRMLAAGSAGTWPGSVVSGVGGAVLGGVAGYFGRPSADGEAGFLMSLLGAFFIVAIYHAAIARRRRA